jgi:erythromycin esterase-like protein
MGPEDNPRDYDNHAFCQQEIDELRAEIERQSIENEQLRTDLHDAGDGDTWREACGRCEKEIERLQKELARHAALRDELLRLRVERDEAREAARFLAFHCGEKLRRQAMEKYPLLVKENK